MQARKSYPSDVSREQFESIRPLLEGVRERTKPRTVDLHEVFNVLDRTKFSLSHAAVSKPQSLHCEALFGSL